MDTKLIDFVLAVAKCGSYLEAAHSLDMSRSAVGMAVDRAEKHLGIRLFNRGQCKPLKITPKGAEVIEQLKVLKREYYKLYTIANTD